MDHGPISEQPPAGKRKRARDDGGGTPPKAKKAKDVYVPPPLSQYEIDRNIKIAANQAFLQTLGLGDNGSNVLKMKRTPVKRKPKRKVEEHEKRKSSRLAGGPAPIERLADNPVSYADFEESRERRQRPRGPRPAPSLLTQEQRELLGAWDMEAFYDWLGETTRFHQAVGTNNRKSVVRQVLKLVTGEGIHYVSATYGWPAETFFRKGEPVTLQDDLKQIKYEAQEFEDTHGRDHGNGWLMKHPLQKMILYCDHLAATTLSGKPAARKKKATVAPPPKKRKAPAPKTGPLDPATVKALREAKRLFDAGKLTEDDYKETKQRLLKPSAPEDEDEDSDDEEEPEAPAATGASLVGRKVNKKFPGCGYFDGVVQSVDDKTGRCVIAWEDGMDTTMTEKAVAKILQD